MSLLGKRNFASLISAAEIFDRREPPGLRNAAAYNLIWHNARKLFDDDRNVNYTFSHFNMEIE